MTDVPTTAWLRGVQIGTIEIAPTSEELEGAEQSWWAVLHLLPEQQELHEIARLGDQAASNFGFLGGVTDEGDRRGRAAIEAFRELQRAIEVRTVSGIALDARVMLWSIDNRTDALSALIDINSQDEGGSGSVARAPVRPRPAAGESSRPDV